MSRTRKLSLDRYITLATQGLPRRERLDTAAELRVHVLERVRELEGQGFPRSEAEHVAVAEMGLPEGTNRAFLGHFFTYRTGWAVLGLVALGAGVWWSQENLFTKAASVEETDLGTPELSSILTSQSLREMTSYQAFNITVPKGAVGLEWSLITGGLLDGSVYAYSSPEELSKNSQPLPNDSRTNRILIAGFSAQSQVCQGQAGLAALLREQKVTSGNVGSSASHICFTPNDRYGVNGSSTSSQTGTLELNTWTVIWSVRLGPDQGNC